MSVTARLHSTVPLLQCGSSGTGCRAVGGCWCFTDAGRARRQSSTGGGPKHPEHGGAAPRSRMSPAERPARRSCSIDLASRGGRQEGRTGHAPQPGLVVDGCEQPTVERDVDPSRGPPVQQQRDQDDIGAAPPVGDVRVGLDGLDRAGRWKGPSRLPPACVSACRCCVPRPLLGCVSNYTTLSSESKRPVVSAYRGSAFSHPPRSPPARPISRGCPGPWIDRVVMRKSLPATSAEMLVGGVPAGAVWAITPAKAGIRLRRRSGVKSPRASRQAGPDPSGPRPTAR